MQNGVRFLSGPAVGTRRRWNIGEAVSVQGVAGKFAVVGQGTTYYQLVSWAEWLEKKDQIKPFVDPPVWKTRNSIHARYIDKYLETEAPAPPPAELENLRDATTAFQPDPNVQAFRDKIIADLEKAMHSDGKVYKTAKTDDALREEIASKLEAFVKKQ